MGLLRNYFRPEFLNRLDEIIVFEALDQEEISKIVELQLERVRRTARGQAIEIQFERSVVEHLAKVGYVPEYGARELRRLIKNEIENKLAKEILRGNLSEGSNITIGYSPSKGITLIQAAPQRSARSTTSQKTSSKSR
jgi:ATP-dependent Clp protease ATP-binding subunit ClpC